MRLAPIRPSSIFPKFKSDLRLCVLCIFLREKSESEDTQVKDVEYSIKTMNQRGVMISTVLNHMQTVRNSEVQHSNKPQDDNPPSFQCSTSQLRVGRKRSWAHIARRESCV